MRASLRRDLEARARDERARGTKWMTPYDLWWKDAKGIGRTRRFRQFLDALPTFDGNIDLAEMDFSGKEMELLRKSLDESLAPAIFGASVVSLDLSDCELTPNRAESLAAGLSVCGTLERLILRNNPLGAVGVELIMLGLLQGLDRLRNLREGRARLAIEAERADEEEVGGVGAHRGGALTGGPTTPRPRGGAGGTHSAPGGRTPSREGEVEGISAEELREALERLPPARSRLVDLDLSNCDVTEATAEGGSAGVFRLQRRGVHAVARFVRREECGLRRLCLAKNRMSDVALAPLVEALASCASLESVELDYSGTGKASAAAILDVATTRVRRGDTEGKGSVEYHPLDRNGPLDKFVESFLVTGGSRSRSRRDAKRTAETRPQMLTLSLRGAELGEDGVEMVRACLSRPSALRRLGLQRCGIESARAADRLCSALLGSRLQTLDLAGNRLGPEGAGAIARFLKHGGARLRSLGLARCSLTDDGRRPEGVLRIASALRENVTLWHLDLRANALVAQRSRHLDDGARHIIITALASALKYNGTLLYLDLRDNWIQIRGQMALLTAIKDAPSAVAHADVILDTVRSWIQHRLWTRAAVLSGGGGTTSKLLSGGGSTTSAQNIAQKRRKPLPMHPMLVERRARLRGNPGPYPGLSASLASDALAGERANEFWDVHFRRQDEPSTALALGLVGSDRPMSSSSSHHHPGSRTQTPQPRAGRSRSPLAIADGSPPSVSPYGPQSPGRLSPKGSQGSPGPWGEEDGDDREADQVALIPPSSAAVQVLNRLREHVSPGRTTFRELRKAGLPAVRIGALGTIEDEHGKPTAPVRRAKDPSERGPVSLAEAIAIALQVPDHRLARPKIPQLPLDTIPSATHEEATIPNARPRREPPQPSTAEPQQHQTTPNPASNPPDKQVPAFPVHEHRPQSAGSDRSLWSAGNNWAHTPTEQERNQDHTSTPSSDNQSPFSGEDQNHQKTTSFSGEDHNDQKTYDDSSIPDATQAIQAISPKSLHEETKHKDDDVEDPDDSFDPASPSYDLRARLSVVQQEWRKVAPGPLPTVQSSLLPTVIGIIFDFLGKRRTIDYRETRTSLGQVVPEFERRELMHGDPVPDHVATSDLAPLMFNPRIQDDDHRRPESSTSSFLPAPKALVLKARGARWDTSDIISAARAHTALQSSRPPTATQAPEDQHKLPRIRASRRANRGLESRGVSTAGTMRWDT